MRIKSNTLNKKVACIAFVFVGLLSTTAIAEPTFRNAITGMPIDFSFGKKAEPTEAVKHFMSTGENNYNQNEEVIKAGENLFATACSGCHGHHAEGKLGPALGDSYWTYPGGQTDKGLFEIVYDGARAMMGPQRNNLTVDEMLTVMAYVRSIYWGEPEKALWLSEEERAKLIPAEMPEEFKEALEKFNESNGS
jgi:cytochrome c-L